MCAVRATAIPASLSAVAGGVKFRDACFDDYEQIAAVQQRNHLETKPFHEWEHLWSGNPEREKNPSKPIGFVVEASGGKVVGYTGLIPLSYHFQGRDFAAATGWGMSVDAPYRGHTLALIRRVVSPQAAEFLVDASAKPSVARILDRFLVHRGVGGRIPAGNWNTAAFWITNYRGFLKSALRARGLPSALSEPAACAMWMRDNWKGTAAWIRAGDERVQQGPDFDERFDQLWDELKLAYPNRWLATRSRKVLQWHFRFALAANRLWILTIGDNSRILAYALFRRQDNPQFGLTRVRLIDFQAVNGDHSQLVPMLAWALRRCREEGIHMLEAYGFRPDKQHIIDALAPHRRALPAWGFFYAAFEQGLKRQLQIPDVWDPSHFDGDESL